jgi:F-type H+-transporting ATPase subunit b
MELLKILGNVGFDWRVALFNFINFLIVFWLVKRFVFRPIKNILDERQKKINDGLEDAKKAKTSLMMAEEKSDEIVSKAKLDGNEIISLAHDQEKAIIDQARTKAEAEAVNVRKKAESLILQEKKKAETEVREGAADLIVDGIKKVLAEEIDRKKSEQIIKDLAKSHD